MSGNQKNGVTTITYWRPLAAKEPVKDKKILTLRSQSVIAAFGPLNSRQEANAHSFMDTTRSDVQVDFGLVSDNHLIQATLYKFIRKEPTALCALILV